MACAGDFATATVPTNRKWDHYIYNCIEPSAIGRPAVIHAEISVSATRSSRVCLSDPRLSSPPSVSKEQLVKLLQFSQLTVQCMQHVKSKALEKETEAEGKVELYHGECQRLQEELKKRMIENCRLIAGGPLGNNSSDAVVTQPEVEEKKRGEEAEEEEAVSRPPEHTEDDKMMLADLVSELKRSKLVDTSKAALLDQEMNQLRLGEHSKLWDVLRRYEDSGDIRLVVKDLDTHIFEAA